LKSHKTRVVPCFDVSVLPWAHRGLEVHSNDAWL
jgi:hypothetical protein